MPVFIYNIEKDGKLIKGEVKANNLQIARIKLKSRNINPVYIKQKPLLPFYAGGSNIKFTEIIFFTRQLSFLLNSGVSLIQALEMCVETIENINFKMVLRRMLQDLEAGKSFSRTLRSRPDIFDGFYVNMVVCAEETGLLDQILQELADYMEKAEAIKSKVKSAMMYPTIVLAISFSIITGIILFVVPKFEALYTGSGGKLPALTQFLVNISNALRNHFLIVAAVIVSVPVVLWQYSKTETGKAQLHTFVSFIPLFGKIQYQGGLVKFCRSFYSLLKSGVNFLQALDVAKNISGHPEIEKGIQISRDYVVKGKSFSKGLEDSKVFPPLVYNMVRIGEESGKIDNSFEKLAMYYEEHLNNLVAGLIKMIEPIMIVVLGGIVGFMILALYLPVFNMGSVVN